MLNTAVDQTDVYDTDAVSQVTANCFNFFSRHVAAAAAKVLSSERRARHKNCCVRWKTTNLIPFFHIYFSYVLLFSSYCVFVKSCGERVWYTPCRYCELGRESTTHHHIATATPVTNFILKFTLYASIVLSKHRCFSHCLCSLPRDGCLNSKRECIDSTMCHRLHLLCKS